MNKLSTALIQHNHKGSQSANLEYVAEEIAKAAAAGAKLVVLQELFAGPYFCQTEDPELFDLAESIQPDQPGATVQLLAKLARQHRLVLVASLFEKRAPGLYHNTAVVFESDGSMAGRYRKMHIPDDPGFYEKFYFTEGDLGFQPIATSVGRLGVLICWDQWFPEAARLMALAGAEVLIYPTAIGWDPQEEQQENQRQLDAWLTIQRGHAIANGLPLLSCNRHGFEPSPDGHTAGTLFWGNSFAVGPQGEWLAQASSDTDHTLVVEIDRQRSENVRRIWPFLRDRRIDAYHDLLKRYRDN
jgi:N-carbamoylputrescine amidase